MKVLVAGGGGREHALVWKLDQEATVYSSPGNPGTAEIAETFSVSPLDVPAFVDLAGRLAVDLVVVGPEDPLIAGLGDALRARGFPVFGPGADAAQLEGSKAFAKDVMESASVPAANGATFTDFGVASDFVTECWAQGRKMVVKASGAALGKGVSVCDTVEEANAALHACLVERIFGVAGETVVVEERLSGQELSLLTLCSDLRFLSLPVAQDYKRVGDGDRGPNTGGMGSYSPVPFATPELVHKAEQSVVAPVLRTLAQRGMSFRGTLFSGLMVHGGEARCLEYNVRFGDPETQSVMMRLGVGFADALMACALGESIPPIEVLDRAAVTVVLASGGYPGAVRKGVPISIGAMPTNVSAFHMGTALKDGALVTNGGRVLSVTACAPTLPEARALAYQGAKAVSFEGMHCRTDVAS